MSQNFDINLLNLRQSATFDGVSVSCAFWLLASGFWLLNSFLKLPHPPRVGGIMPLRNFRSIYECCPAAGGSAMTAFHPLHPHTPHHIVWKYLLPILLGLLAFFLFASPVHGQVWVDASQLDGKVPEWVDRTYYRPAPPVCYQPPVVRKVWIEPVYRSAPASAATPSRTRSSCSFSRATSNRAPGKSSSAPATGKPPAARNSSARAIGK
jgi:hypothetical protein